MAKENAELAAVGAGEANKKAAFTALKKELAHDLEEFTAKQKLDLRAHQAAEAKKVPKLWKQSNIRLNMPDTSVHFFVHEFNLDIIEFPTNLFFSRLLSFA